MTRRLPPLNALRAFEAAARHLSFTLAANELSVTQGAISRQIKGLEDFLGVRLFYRMHRRLMLTREGEMLLPATSTSLDKIAAIASSVSTHEKVLKIKAPPTYAMRWFYPRLGRFQSERPDVPVRLTTAFEHWVDFDQQTFDAIVVFGIADWGENVIADRLKQERLMPVCSPELLTGPEPLLDFEDLTHHTLLHPTRDHSDWRAWLMAAGVTNIDPNSGQEFDTLELAMTAAANGYGVAIGDYSLLEEDLAANRLALPFDLEIGGGAYYLVYPASVAESKKFKVFRDWLLAESRDNRQPSIS